jgi:hypothetical protein
MLALLYCEGAETVFRMLGWFWIFLMLPQCVLGFALLTSHRYWPAYQVSFLLLLIRIRIDFKSWIRIRIRLNSWIRIRIFNTRYSASIHAKLFFVYPVPKNYGMFSYSTCDLKG